MKKEIKLPEGKMCSKTLCGQCKWLDYNQPTKTSPYYFFCKQTNSYKDPELNTSCKYWEP